MILIENAKLYSMVTTPTAPPTVGWVRCEGARIVEVGTGTSPTIAEESATLRVDAGGAALIPGFIDMHIHGSMGVDTMDADADGLRRMAQFLARHGVTGFLATTMTASHMAITRALETVATVQGTVRGGATILGAHLEGPYINVQAKGAQSGEFVREADPQEYEPWFELNVIREVTAAPEFAASLRFFEACAARGIVGSIGHTTATYDQALKAVDAGARQATHTYNAMTGLHHRNPGVVGAALADERLCCELIVDLMHVHPAAVKIAVAAKTPHNAILITDAIRAAGMGDGETELGGQAVTVRGGKATLADGTLAGSVLTMERGLKNLLTATGLPLAQVWPMTSLNAARQLGLDHQLGQIRPGYQADLVLLDDALDVQLTLAHGEIVYQRGSVE